MRLLSRAVFALVLRDGGLAVPSEDHGIGHRIWNTA